MVKEVKSNAEFQEIAKQAKGKLMVIDFFATWCGPCVGIAPTFQEYSEKYKNVIFVKVDVDNTDLDAVCKKYEINCMPTFVFVKEDTEVDRLEGAEKKELENKIKQHST